MSHSAAEVLAGAAVLAVAAGFALYAASGVGGPGAGSGTYPLTASFRSIQGISEGADVRLAGVKVGTLRDIRLNPQTFFADTTIEMAQGVDLPADSAILISQDGLLGGSYVEILPGGAVEVLAPGDEILDTQGAVSLISLLMKFVGGSEDKPAESGG